MLTGGLGGIGLEVTSWLVKELGARHICLLGRSGPNEKAEERLEELRKVGAEIEVIQADVSQFEDLKRALLRFEGKLPPIRGVIHMAGVARLLI